MTQSASEPTRRRFHKTRHLLRHSDFERVYKQGRRHFARHLTVFYLQREGEPALSGLRIGFTVGKVLGNAVERNRMRRVLREAARLSGLEGRVDADVVVNPKKSLLDAEFTEVRSEVGKAFEVIAKALSRA
ncbi:MAG TPA: ribonuclease P protein component [Terriglobales bacterium]